MPISGGAPTPQPVDPFAQAQAQIQIEQQRNAIAEQNRIAEEERRQAEEARQRTEFDTNLANARAGATTAIQDQFASRGADPVQYQAIIDQVLNDTARGVPQLDPNPGAFFDSNVTNLALQRGREDDQRRFRQSFNEFAPVGFASQRIGDDADDAILASILGTQFDDANRQVRLAFDRGTLNQTGFDSALASLNNQRTVGQAQLDEIGRAVLEQGRGDLRREADFGREAIGAHELGGNFDPNQFRQRIDDSFDAFSTGLEGRIRSAVGDQQFFDPVSLIGRGGAAQGVTNNPGQPALASALQRREEERRRSRGLGSQGAF